MTPPLCACGCGEKVTTRVRSTVNRKGLKKGQWNRYRPGHGGRARGVRFDRKTEATGCCKTAQGYVFVREWDHPKASPTRMIPQAHLIAEAALGKFLPPGAKVWHFDRDPGGTKNLVVCENHSYLAVLNARRRSYEGCGDPNLRKCCRCGVYDHPENMVKNGRGMRHRQRQKKCWMG